MARTETTTQETQPGATTIEQLQAAAAARRNAAVETYRILLLRNHKPESGDAKQLAEVAAILGRGPEDFAVDRGCSRRSPSARGSPRQNASCATNGTPVPPSSSSSISQPLQMNLRCSDGVAAQSSGPGPSQSYTRFSTR